MTTPLLQLKNVTQIFGKKSEQTSALEDMTLALDEDFPKIITVAGESGSGKTSMGMFASGLLWTDDGGGAVSGQATV